MKKKFSCFCIKIMCVLAKGAGCKEVLLTLYGFALAYVFLYKACTTGLNWTYMHKVGSVRQRVQKTLYIQQPVDRKTVCIDKHIQYAAVCYTI